MEGRIDQAHGRNKPAPIQGWVRFPDRGEAGAIRSHDQHNWLAGGRSPGCRSAVLVAACLA